MVTLRLNDFFLVWGYLGTRVRGDAGSTYTLISLFQTPLPAIAHPPQEKLACVEADHAVISLGATLTRSVAVACVLIRGN